MAATPQVVYGQDIGSSYQKQELTPSKQFKFTEPGESVSVKYGKHDQRETEWGARGKREVVLLEQH